MTVFERSDIGGGERTANMKYVIQLPLRWSAQGSCFCNALLKATERTAATRGSCQAQVQLSRSCIFISIRKNGKSAMAIIHITRHGPRAALGWPRAGGGTPEGVSAPPQCGVQCTVGNWGPSVHCGQLGAISALWASGWPDKVAPELVLAAGGQ